jgi:hypothetical protein
VQEKKRLTIASSLTAARERFLLKPKGLVWAAAAEARALCGIERGPKPEGVMASFDPKRTWRAFQAPKEKAPDAPRFSRNKKTVQSLLSDLYAAEDPRGFTL